MNTFGIDLKIKIDTKELKEFEKKFSQSGKKAGKNFAKNFTKQMKNVKIEPKIDTKNFKKQTDKLKSQLNKLNNVKVKPNLNNKQFNSGITQMGKGVTGFKNQFQKDMNTVRGGFLASIGGSIWHTAYKLATKFFQAVKQGFTDMTEAGREAALVTTLLTQEQIDIMGGVEGIKQMGSAIGETFNMSTVDSIKSTYQAISAGVDPSAVQSFMDLIGQVSVAGDITMEQGTNIITAYANAWGIAYDDTERLKQVTDSLTLSMVEGKLTMSEMVNPIGKVSANASLMGLSINETNAAISSMTKINGSAVKSGNALNAMLSKILQPSIKAQKIFKEIGVPFGKEAITDAGGMNNYLQMITESLKGTNYEITDLISGQRAQHAALLLTDKAAGFFTQTLDRMTESSKNAGEVTEGAFKKVEESLSHRIGVIKQKASNLFAGMADSLTPVINKVLNLAESLMPVLQTLLKEIAGFLEPFIENFLKLFDGLKGLGAPIMKIFSSVGKLVNNVISALVPVFIKIGKAITPFVEKFAELLEEIITPISEIIGDILDKLSKGFMPIIMAVMNILTQLLNAVIEPIKEILAELSPVIQEAYNNLKPILDWAVRFLNGSLKPILFIFNIIVKVIAEITKGLMKLSTAFMKGVQPVIDFIFGKSKEEETIAKKIKDDFEEAGNTIDEINKKIDKHKEKLKDLESISFDTKVIDSMSALEGKIKEIVTVAPYMESSLTQIMNSESDLATKINQVNHLLEKQKEQLEDMQGLEGLTTKEREQKLTSEVETIATGDQQQTIDQSMEELAELNKIREADRDKNWAKDKEILQARIQQGQEFIKGEVQRLKELGFSYDEIKEKFKDYDDIIAGSEGRTGISTLVSDKEIEDFNALMELGKEYNKLIQNPELENRYEKALKLQSKLNGLSEDQIESLKEGITGESQIVDIEFAVEDLQSIVDQQPKPEVKADIEFTDDEGNIIEIEPEIDFEKIDVLKQDLANLQDERSKIPVGADTSEVDEKIREVTKNIKTLEDKGLTTLDVNVDVNQAWAEAGRLQDKLKELENQKIESLKLDPEMDITDIDSSIAEVNNKLNDLKKNARIGIDVSVSGSDMNAVTGKYKELQDSIEESWENMNKQISNNEISGIENTTKQVEIVYEASRRRIMDDTKLDENQKTQMLKELEMERENQLYNILIQSSGRLDLEKQLVDQYNAAGEAITESANATASEEALKENITKYSVKELEVLKSKLLDQVDYLTKLKEELLVKQQMLIAEAKLKRSQKETYQQQSEFFEDQIGTLGDPKMEKAVTELADTYRKAADKVVIPSTTAIDEEIKKVEESITKLLGKADEVDTSLSDFTGKTGKPDEIEFKPIVSDPDPKDFDSTISKYQQFLEDTIKPLESDMAIEIDKALTDPEREKVRLEFEKKIYDKLKKYREGFIEDEENDRDKRQASAERTIRELSDLEKAFDRETAENKMKYENEIIKIQMDGAKDEETKQKEINKLRKDFLENEQERYKKLLDKFDKLDFSKGFVEDDGNITTLEEFNRLKSEQLEIEKEINGVVTDTGISRLEQLEAQKTYLESINDDLGTYETDLKKVTSQLKDELQKIIDTYEAIYDTDKIKGLSLDEITGMPIEDLKEYQDALERLKALQDGIIVKTTGVGVSEQQTTALDTLNAELDLIIAKIEEPHKFGIDIDTKQGIEKFNDLLDDIGAIESERNKLIEEMIDATKKQILDLEGMGTAGMSPDEVSKYYSDLKDSYEKLAFLEGERQNSFNEELEFIESKLKYNKDLLQSLRDQGASIQEIMIIENLIVDIEKEKFDLISKQDQKYQEIIDKYKDLETLTDEQKELFNEAVDYFDSKKDSLDTDDEIENTKELKGVFKEISDLILQFGDDLTNAFKDGEISASEMYDMVMKMTENIVSKIPGIGGEIAGAMLGVISLIQQVIETIRLNQVKKITDKALEDTRELIELNEEINRILDSRKRLMDFLVGLGDESLNDTIEQLEYLKETLELMLGQKGFDTDLTTEQLKESYDELLEKANEYKDIIATFDDDFSDLTTEWSKLNEMVNLGMWDSEELLKRMGEIEEQFGFLDDLGISMSDFVVLNEEEMLNLLNERLGGLESELENYESILDLQQEIIEMSKKEISERYRIAEIKALLSDDEEAANQSRIDEIEEMLERADELQLTELERLELQLELKSVLDEQNKALNDQNYLLNDNVRALIRQVIEARKLGDSFAENNAIENAAAGLLAEGLSQDQIEDLLGAEIDWSNISTPDLSIPDFGSNEFLSNLKSTDIPALNVGNDLTKRSNELLLEQNNILRIAFGDLISKTDKMTKISSKNLTDLNNNLKTSKKISDSNISRIAGTISRNNYS